MEALITNLSSPPLLFFFLGILAAFVRSDLEMPPQVAKFLILYLLFAIGFKGGVALSDSELGLQVWLTLLAAVFLSSVVPIYVFLLLRKRLALADAAAIAATYGSISAVTFVTCASYLDANGIPWNGYMIAAMALMESPAIILGILFYRLWAGKSSGAGKSAIDWRELGREALLNGSVLLITGSLVIGWISGARGMAQVQPFVSELFIGFLCLFLLDMGIVAAARFRELRPHIAAQGTMNTVVLIPLAIVFPLINGTLAMGLAWLLDLSIGNALLLTILGASASYIAVPAAMRLALPESNPSLYLPMSLAISFPFNLLIGIPLYHEILRRLI